MTSSSTQETEQQQCTLSKEQKREAKRVALGRKTARALSAEHVLLNMTRQRKGMAKDIDREAQFNEMQPGFSPEKTGTSPSGNKVLLQCLNYKRGKCSHDRECDYSQPPHCKYFKNDICQMGKDCPLAKEKRSTNPQRKEKGKAKVTENKGQVTVAIVNIANHRPRNKYFRKAFAIRNFVLRNDHKKASCAQTETFVRKDKHKIPTAEFGESKIQGQKSISERNANRWDKPENRQMDHRMTKSSQSGMRSKKSLQDFKHTNIKKRSSRRKDTTEMSTVQTSS